MIGVAFVHRPAGREIYYLDSPEGRLRRRARCQQAFDFLGERGSRCGCGEQREDGESFHRPVTFDSSHISSKSVITRKVPRSGSPITTPIPTAPAA